MAGQIGECAAIGTVDEDRGVGERNAAEAARAAALRRLEAELPILRAVARKLCRDRAEADDLVQDVVERALRSLDRMDLEGNPRGWLVTILHHLHIDHCRQRARRATDVSADDVPLRNPEPTPEPIWARVSGAELGAAVERLGQELRQTYVMFAFHGRSYVEIAESLGIPKATVGTRLVRAREQLKRLLTAKGTEAWS